jgi:hypothetical protein
MLLHLRPDDTLLDIIMVEYKINHLANRFTAYMFVGYTHTHTHTHVTRVKLQTLFYIYKKGLLSSKRGKPFFFVPLCLQARLKFIMQFSIR